MKYFIFMCVIYFIKAITLQQLIIIMFLVLSNVVKYKHVEFELKYFFLFLGLNSFLNVLLNFHKHFGDYNIFIYLLIILLNKTKNFCLFLIF